MSRFTKLNVAGAALAIEATDHVAILDVQLSREWYPHDLQANNWQEAMDLCTALGDDWRAPTIDELASLCDRSRRQPACDPIFDMSHSDWHWSSSPVVGWPEGAWLVYFSGGSVNGSGLRYDSGFVRPVRVARARQ